MRILILGFSKTGKSVYSFLKGKEEIYVYDKNRIDIKEYLSYKDIVNNWMYFDYVIRSPGIKSTSKIYMLATQLTNKIVSDIEFAFLYLPKGRIIGVTGTNGKTTLVKMLDHLLKERYHCIVCGNIGIPIFDIIAKVKLESILIIELSSFQLENIYSKKFDYGIILNISENHLNAVPNYAYYKASKLKLINLSDIYLTSKEIEKLYYPFKIMLKRIFLPQLKVVYYIGNKLGLEDRYIEDRMNSFQSLSFRVEEIHHYGNLTFINDSKSTSISSTNACLSCFNDRNRILIIGGISKSSSFKNINLKNDDIVIGFGKARYIIYKDLKCAIFQTLEEVIIFIKRKYIKGNYYIIFSPACSSFDQYSSFEERGENFNFLINKYF